MSLCSCRSYIKTVWSYMIAGHIDCNAPIHLCGNPSHVSTRLGSGGWSRFSTYKGHNEAASVLPRLDGVTPDLDDEVGGVDTEDYEVEDPYYPLQLLDFNRKRSWESTFLQFKRRMDEMKHGATNFGMSNESGTSPFPTLGGEPPDAIDGTNEFQHSGMDHTCATSDIDSITTPALNHEQLKTRNGRLATCIETYLRERLNPHCSVGLFGSAINGLWTDASDLDVCVQIPNVTSRSATIRNLRRIAFLLGPLAPERVFENRFTAKIPILHWKRGKVNKKAGNPLIEELGCSIDISVNNVLALSNSALIGTYVACDPRVKSMVLALKLWARSRDLNDRSKGTFGSFALSLMVIHFLQRCTPPVLISLQDLAIANNESPKYVSGIDVRFTTNMEQINKELNWVSKGTRNTMSTIKLIQEFFYYFGWTYTKNTNVPIAIRSVDFQFMKNQSTLITNAGAFDMDEKFMHVDNPFEVGIDVANISFHQRNRIIKELRRGYKLLKSGCKFEDVLQD